jgi:hypothetical protein
MLIGDSVTYDGRRYVAVGFTPISVRPAEVELRDPRTGETMWVDRTLVAESELAERAALRVVPHRRSQRSHE